MEKLAKLVMAPYVAVAIGIGSILGFLCSAACDAFAEGWDFYMDEWGR